MAAESGHGPLEAMLEVVPPQRTALVFGAQRIAYGELRQRAETLARSLAIMGVRRGGSIAVWLLNGPEWVVVEFAAARLGAMVVALNPRYRSHELERILALAGPQALLYTPRIADAEAILQEVLGNGALSADGGVRSERFPGLRQLVVCGGHSAPGVAYRRLEEGISASGPVPPRGEPGDVVNLFFTSGTTSAPKAATHTQAAILRHAHNVNAAFGTTVDDRLLIALPLCGVFGFTALMSGLAAGATCVLQPVFDAAAAAECIARERITVFHAADSMYKRILELPGLDALRLASLREGGIANFTGQPRQLLDELERRAGVRLYQVYGSSEAFALMSCWRPEDPLELRSLGGGRPVSEDIEVRACDPETGAELAPEQPGELQIRGYNVTGGYLRNPEATAAAFTPDGWFRTGDLGYRRSDGSFVYLSRLKDSLRVRGFLVDPVEIEEYLSGHPAVIMAQVVGVDVPGKGERPVAFVKLRPGAPAPDELIVYCRKALSAFKVPALVVPLDEFPVAQGPNGEKVQKVKLRKMAAEMLRNAAG